MIPTKSYTKALCLAAIDYEVMASYTQLPKCRKVGYQPCTLGFSPAPGIINVHKFTDGLM